ncbi:hypothetical protein [Sediminitomix flava]|uniref:Outer membrane protein with beta-barrel domain n=1 Tax=Sediminitomix flava TaxID=379075 RepID=A0A315ZDZ9_SEDFL|nr:hypothetical protein [Sediminitomix flava]PWJ43359.1 hypothetical protein BC781_102916 [Sediminitomix flava]
MKRFFFLFFLLFITLGLQAQHALWTVGGSLHNEGLRLTSKADDLRLKNKAWGAGIYTTFLVMDGITVTPSFRYSFNSTASFHINSPNSFEDFLPPDNLFYNNPFAEVKGYAVGIEGNFYILKFFENRFIEQVRENFFTGFGLSWHSVTLNHGIPELPPTGPPVGEFPNFQTSTSSAAGLGINLSAGYHFYVTDRVSISPILRFEYLPSKTFDGLGDALNSQNPSSTEKMSGINPAFEIRVGYAIKQRLPLCPIKSCKVQQEHRHAILGGARLRGNPYNLRQNQKYGDIHRGQVKQSKDKLSKAEKRERRKTKKMQKKNQQRKRRLIIVGG